ncbi:mannonate dehydratase [Rhodospirillales bacterium]|nr:mannonate dehydratase [Rhodospirillales bacterium]
MLEGWRHFGEKDTVPLNYVIQTGVKHVVATMENIKIGEPWPADQVKDYRNHLKQHGFDWIVCEGLSVHESVKTHKGNWRTYVENYKTSLRSLGAAGIKVATFNFMPVTAWTRTDFKYPLPNEVLTSRFDWSAYVAFDLFILNRAGAEDYYSPEDVKAAKKLFASMNEAEKIQLANSIGLGAPGIVDDQDVDVFLAKIAAYGDVSHQELQDRLIEFLKEVAPVAEECDVRIGFHPDDPPQPLFGLPRVVSSADDVRRILNEVDSDHVGITFCIGSYASNAANDTLEMVQEFAHQIHYCHLRNVIIEDDGRSFVEVGHLNGRNNIVKIIDTLQKEEKRRQLEGRTDIEIPWRPDHGPLMFFERDAENVEDIYPGYSLIGRYAGMSELRGVIAAIQAQH